MNVTKEAIDKMAAYADKQGIRHDGFVEVHPSYGDVFVITCGLLYYAWDLGVRFERGRTRIDWLETTVPKRRRWWQFWRRKDG